jgi:hypothetical protein
VTQPRRTIVLSTSFQSFVVKIVDRCAIAASEAKCEAASCPSIFFPLTQNGYEYLSGPMVLATPENFLRLVQPMGSGLQDTNSALYRGGRLERSF